MMVQNPPERDTATMALVLFSSQKAKASCSHTQYDFEYNQNYL